MIRRPSTSMIPVLSAIVVLLQASDAFSDPERSGTDTKPYEIVQTLPLAVLRDRPECFGLPDPRLEEIPLGCITGVFHVVIHYINEDVSVGHPDKRHWRDRAWRITAWWPTTPGTSKNPHILWEDFPDVKFAHAGERFTPGRGSSRGRSLIYWEPDADQRAELRSGVAVVEGTRSRKKLERVTPCSWVSQKPKSHAGAFTFTYYKTYEVRCDHGTIVLEYGDQASNPLVKGGGAAIDSGRTTFTLKRIEIVDVDGFPTLRMRGDYTRDHVVRSADDRFGAYDGPAEHGTFIATRVPGFRSTEEMRDQMTRQKEKELRRSLGLGD